MCVLPVPEVVGEEEALLVLDTLRKEGRSDDPESVRSWLKTQAEGLYADAMNALNAKDQRVSVCNTMETLLVHARVAPEGDHRQ